MAMSMVRTAITIDEWCHVTPPFVMGSPEPPLTVACLCAAWCGTCRDFEQGFMALGQSLPYARFYWCDVEDLELDIEIETFPTIVIRQGMSIVFAGPIIPSLPALTRLCETAHAGKLAAVSNAAEFAAAIAHLPAGGAAE